MKKSTIVLLSTTMLLLGIVIGFLTSPVKHGINVGNRSGNHGIPISKDNHCCANEFVEEDAD